MWERFAFPLSVLLLLASALQNVTLSGAEFVFNSFLSSFTEDLLAVAQTTEATISLDATVGGTLAKVILVAFGTDTTPQQLHPYQFHDDTHRAQTTRL